MADILYDVFCSGPIHHRIIIVACTVNFTSKVPALAISDQGCDQRQQTISSESIASGNQNVL